MPERSSFSQVVRIANTDIPGEETLVYGLSRIKGIGYTTALAIARKLGLDPTVRVGYLSAEALKRVWASPHGFTTGGRTTRRGRTATWWGPS